MSINRRSLKIAQRYGTGIRNHENDTRDEMLNATEKFKVLYKGMDKETQRKINYQDGLEQARSQETKAKSMKFVDDIDMLVKKGSDRPWSLSEFTRKIKENLNNGLILIPNMLIGENMGGHSVHFNSAEGPEFICGVGKNLEQVIMPETELHNVNDGTKIERKIKSRGYLAAINITIAWLEKHQLSVRNKNFLN